MNFAFGTAIRGTISAVRNKTFLSWGLILSSRTSRFKEITKKQSFGDIDCIGMFTNVLQKEVEGEVLNTLSSSNQYSGNVFS